MYAKQKRTLKYTKRKNLAKQHQVDSKIFVLIAGKL